jgi:uncharacterized circularly permuted ATP-grasp superfamily protein
VKGDEIDTTADGGYYEEAFVEPGVPRREYAALMRALAGLSVRELGREVTMAAAERGVTFGENEGAFLIDPVPRVLTAEAWHELEAGLIQRVRALDAFVTDVYGARRIVAAGVVPDYVVESAAYYEPAVAGSAPVRPVAIAGLDVVRDHEGRFRVLEDNVRTPSGIAYAVVARELMRARLPEPVEGLRGIDDAFALLAGALHAAAPERRRRDPAVVVLSDGPENTAWWEHCAIAERLQAPLVELGDLDVAGDGLYARVDGRPLRVDVVYRRTNEDRLSGSDGGLTSVGSVLHEPWRRGQVGLVNGFGVGVADDKLAHAYVEDMVRFYLGQEPIVRSVPTYDLTDPEVREEVLGRVDELVIKPRDGSGGHGVLVGPHADDGDRATTLEALRTSPEAYVAQEMVRLSRHPTVVDDRLEPRHVDLRAFVFLAGEHAAALAGGLTRVALDAGALVVNSSQNGGAKDTWVLACAGRR